MTGEPCSLLPLQPADYHAPSLPTVDALQAFMGRLRQLLRQSDKQPFIADDRLQRATLVNR